MAGTGDIASGAMDAVKGRVGAAAKDKGKEMATDAGKSAIGAGDSGQSKGAAAPGGIAPARSREQQSEMASPGASDAAKAAAVGAAVPAAGAAGQIAMLMMFLKWLKSLLAAMAAMFSNLLSAILGIIIAMAKAVVGFFIGLGAGIVSVVGGAIGTGVAAMGSFVVTIFLVIGGSVATVAAVQTSDLARHEPAVMADCSADFAQTVSMTDGTIDAGAETEANAQLIYSVLAGWGMPDENIAGIIGNWDAESGIDPTSVEGIFDERFHIGPSKQQAIDEDFGGFGYGDYSVEYRGIGLAQWTNGRNPNLRKYAERAGLEWYQIEAQLGFMISADEGSDAEIVKGMIRESLDSPGAAALYFHDEWERSADTSMMKQRRLDSASSWYAKMGGWEADHDLANSILEQSGTALEGADKAAVRTAMNECVSQGLNIDNTELATAWASYAWPYKEDSRFNDGTYLYVWLHEEIFPGDPYFASCDRGVATGVRWSGTDDTYPPGAVQQQINYLQTSDKWEQVTEWNGDESVLRPGDIFIRKDSEVSHTIAYTGPDAPMQIWGAGKYEPGANIMHSSLSSNNGRSPGLDRIYGGSQGMETYAVFRSTGPEASSQYTSLTPPASAKAGEGDKGRYTTPH